MNTRTPACTATLALTAVLTALFATGCATEANLDRANLDQARVDPNLAKGRQQLVDAMVVKRKRH